MLRVPQPRVWFILLILTFLDILLKEFAPNQEFPLAVKGSQYKQMLTCDLFFHCCCFSPLSLLPFSFPQCGPWLVRHILQELYYWSLSLSPDHIRLDTGLGQKREGWENSPSVSILGFWGFEAGIKEERGNWGLKESTCQGSHGHLDPGLRLTFAIALASFFKPVDFGL